MKKTFTLLASALVLVLSGAYFVHAQTSMMDGYGWEPNITRYNDHYGMMNYGLGGYGLFGGGIVALIFWLLLIGSIVALVRYFSHDSKMHSTPSRSDNAMNILKERYAKGEIGKEEFDAKKEDLEN